MKPTFKESVEIGNKALTNNIPPMNEKNEILERFAAFFKASNQTTCEASQNMSDLEKMSIKRLSRLCINFNI